MGTKLVDTLGTFEYSDSVYAVHILRSQKTLADEVLERLGGNLMGKSRTYYVKLRKEFLAAMLADWDTATLPVDTESAIAQTHHDRIKPEGMTRSLYPKQRRVRHPRSKDGVSRKSRREYTKNKHRAGRGMRRLQLAQAA